MFKIKWDKEINGILLTDKTNDELIAEANKHGVNVKEELFDPKTGRKIATASMGPAYMLKLMHMVDKKMTSRGPRATYNADLQPTKGGKNSARAMDRLTWNGLIAHGARENMREMSTYKSERNPELWNAVRLGLPLPTPKTPFVVDKMFNMMAAGGINVKKDGDILQLTPMTDKETLARSNGEIDDAQVMMAKNLRPIKDGLFDDTKTGGLIGTKWTHINLAEPIVNPVMEKPVKSLLGLNAKEFSGLMHGTYSYDPTLGTVVNALPEEGRLSGGTAFKAMLKKVDVNKAIRTVTSQALSATGASLDKLNKKMYTVLIKKTVKPITDDLLKKIVSHYLDKELSDIDIDIVDSFYLNGNWDWMISFTAPDIVKAKKFCDILNTLYTEHIQDILLLEQLYANKRCGIPNPNKKQLEEFKANTS